MKTRSYLLIFFLIFSSSCTLTKWLWDKNYQETFHKFLVDSGGEKIVFLGANYHYIFDDRNHIILELLNSKSRSSLFINTRQTQIFLNHQNQIHAQIVVEAIDNALLSHEEYHSLESLGFRNNKEGNLVLALDVHGIRYSAENWVGKDLPRLNRTYVVAVHYNNTLFSAIGKAALTPITIGADAVLLIGKTILLPFRSN